MTKQERVELIKTLPKRMLVRDSNNDRWRKRLVLHILPGNANYPVITVIQCDESKFEQGKEYNITYYEHCKELPQAEEMTLEQVCKELGKEIKIIK
jgi:hypothetical protein